MPVTSQTIQDGPRIAVMKFTWDTGSAETNVVKVDASTLSGHPRFGTTCSGVAIEQIWYMTSDDTNVDIEWVATGDTIFSVRGDGHKDYRSVGPITAGITNGTGDISFSTIGTPAATSRYSITLSLRKSYDKPNYESYLNLPGETGDYASTLDSAELSIVGDMDVRVDCQPDDWTSLQTVMSKFAAAPESTWHLQILANGALQFVHSADGTALLTAESSVATGFVDGTRHRIRATIDVDNGASGWDVDFFTSPSSGLSPVWTQLGNTITTGTASSMDNGTGPVEIGSHTGGTLQLFTGRVYQAEILDGIAGTVDYDADFRTQVVGTTSLRELSANDDTVTINQTGDPVAEILATS